MSTQIEMVSHFAILCIRDVLERNDSGALHNVATCQAVLHNRVPEALPTLPGTTDVVAGFYEDSAVAVPGQTEKADTNGAVRQ